MTQVFVDPDRRGDATLDDAADMLAETIASAGLCLERIFAFTLTPELGGKPDIHVMFRATRHFLNRAASGPTTIVFSLVRISTT